MNSKLVVGRRKGGALCGPLCPLVGPVGFALALSSAAPALSTSYRAAELNRDGIILIESESVRRSGNTVNVTLLTLPADERGHAGHAVFLIEGAAELNCAAGTIRYKKLSFRGGSQELVGTDVRERAAAPIPKGGPARNIFQFLCKDEGEKAPLMNGSVAQIYKAYQDTLMRGEVR